MKHYLKLPRWLLLCAGAALPFFSGCTQAPDPAFHLNYLALSDSEVNDSAQQQTIANVLTALFGTPDKPYVLPATGLDSDKIVVASGPVWSDQHGKARGLYRQHCGHCHGTSGDGAGPTAAILNPYPRDYRQGKFKFKSTERAAVPTDADLTRIVRQGVMGTAMPSFDLLPDDEVAALVEYVKYLSMRGQTELALIAAIADLGEDEKLELTPDKLIGEILQPVVEKWKAAPEQVIKPIEKPELALDESIAKGRALFYGDKANCVKCHGPSALGDGQTNDYDDWMKQLFEMQKKINEGRIALAENKELSAEERKSERAKLDAMATALATHGLEPRNIIPRNLRLGIYRGGRRPLDLYRRIYAGINGVPMPGVGPATPGGQGPISNEEIWNLVDYVQSLPYEAISKPQRAPSLSGRAAM